MRHSTKKENTGKHLQKLGIGDEFLCGTPDMWSAKVILDKTAFIKMKTSALQKTLLREWKDKPENGGNI